MYGVRDEIIKRIKRNSRGGRVQLGYIQQYIRGIIVVVKIAVVVGEWNVRVEQAVKYTTLVNDSAVLDGRSHGTLSFIDFHEIT